MSSKLDFQQIIKSVYDPNTEALNVTGISGGGAASDVTITDITSTNPLLTKEDFTVLTSVDTAFGSINGSAGAFTEVVASLSADCVVVSPYETTGSKIGLYTGAAAAETLLFIIGQGQDSAMRVNIAAGTRISIRSTEASGPSSGSLILTFSGRV